MAHNKGLKQSGPSINRAPSHIKCRIAWGNQPPIRTGFSDWHSIDDAAELAEDAEHQNEQYQDMGIVHWLEYI